MKKITPISSVLLVLLSGCASGPSKSVTTSPQRTTAELVADAQVNPALFEQLDENGQTLLHRAVDENNSELLEIIITSGADINARTEDGDSALHLAAAKDRALVRSLLDHGADPNVRNKQAATALITAIQTPCLPCVDAILDSAVDLRVKDQAGKDAFTYALEANQPSQLARLLIDKDVLEQRDGLGETALHYSVRHGDADLVAVIVELGANVEATSKNGYRPLHLAAVRGDTGIIQTLISAGAKIDAVSDTGVNALHVAGLGDNIAAAELLAIAGARPLELVADGDDHFGTAIAHLAYSKALFSEDSIATSLQALARAGRALDAAATTFSADLKETRSKLFKAKALGFLAAVGRTVIVAAAEAAVQTYVPRRGMSSTYSDAIALSGAKNSYPKYIANKRLLDNAATIPMYNAAPTPARRSNRSKRNVAELEQHKKNIETRIARIAVHRQTVQKTRACMESPNSSVTCG